MALCSEDGREFYEVLECKNPSDWIAENVIPVINKDSIHETAFRIELKKYLEQFKRINIIADWPEDIAHFCNILIYGTGFAILTPPLTMEVIEVDAEAHVPHNALEDARALRLAIINMIG